MITYFSQYDEGEEILRHVLWERELATSVERNRIEIEIKVFSENGDLLGKSKVLKRFSHNERLPLIEMLIAISLFCLLYY